MSGLTHVNADGEARMVDISEKDVTNRIAKAEGFVCMAPETLAMIVEGTAPKGDVLACARIAGIMAAKRTADLIPLCHPLNITKSEVVLTPFATSEHPKGKAGVHVEATLGVTGKTGIEMEALTAVSVACLTIYDMCKAVDRGMEITNIRLLHKEGGKSGTWSRED